MPRRDPLICGGAGGRSAGDPIWHSPSRSSPVCPPSLTCHSPEQKPHHPRQRQGTRGLAPGSVAGGEVVEVRAVQYCWAASDPSWPSKTPVMATVGSQAPDFGLQPVGSLPLGPVQTGDERGVIVKPLAEGLLAASAACATSAPEARASTARACFGSGLSAWRIISASDHVTLTWLAPMFTWRVGRPNLRTWASVRTADKNLAWARSIFRY